MHDPETDEAKAVDEADAAETTAEEADDDAEELGGDADEAALSED